MKHPRRADISRFLRRHRHIGWLPGAMDRCCQVVEKSRQWGTEHPVYPARKDLDNLRSQYEIALEQVPKDGLALDVGCGSGYGAAILARRAAHVYAVDLSHDALTYARFRYHQGNISFLHQDACQLLFRDDLFDVVAQMGNLEHLDYPELSVHEAHRVLRPGGTYVSTVPIREVSPQSPFHLTHFSFDRYRRLLEAYFDLERIEQTPYQKYLAVGKKRRCPRHGRDRCWIEANAELRMDAFDQLHRMDRRLFHLDRYAFAADRLGGQRVLDVACGTGYGARLMGLRGVGPVLGADHDPQAVAYARRHHRLAETTFLTADAARLPLFEHSFDAAVSFETIEHLEEDRDFLAGLARAVRPGGTVILSTPNRWPATPHHVRSYDYETIDRLLGDYFAVESVYNQNSGSPWRTNRGRPRGIVPTTPENRETAECFIFELRAALPR